MDAVQSLQHICCPRKSRPYPTKRSIARSYLAAGFTVSILTRRRHMPDNHTVADMADDCAALVRDDFAGRVELVVGGSYGGMIALYLDARHPDQVGNVAIVACAAEAAGWAKEVDARTAHAMAGGDTAGAMPL
jgi:pimeloyl-ACP methyl ester carboxylesterase